MLIYRLPLGLSPALPVRSFCPSCRKPIRGWQNIPLFSYLILRGRCGGCRAPIAAQYPVVEALTGLLFVTVLHLLTIDRVREPLTTYLYFPGDIALILTWFLLVAAMVICSATDLTSYMVDVRVTWFALFGGIALNMFLPRPEVLIPVATHPLGPTALAIGMVGLIVFALTPLEPDDFEEDPPPDYLPHGEGIPPPSSEASIGAARADLDAGAADADPTRDTDALHASPVIEIASKPSFVLGALLTLPFVVAAIGLILRPWLVELAGLDPLDIARLSRASTELIEAPWIYLSIGVLLMLTIVGAGSQPSYADVDIAEEIEAEAPLARSIAISELLYFMPALLAGAALLALMLFSESFWSGWDQFVRWHPLPDLTMSRTFQPIAGLTYAVHGAVVGAAAGWFLRIVFTLIFGREAFGTGDIYILGAAGACVGWDIALLGMALSIPLALVGWIVSLFFKRGILIPFGPWLALGFLAALWQNTPAHALVGQYAEGIQLAWQNNPQVLAMAGGLLLVGSSIAIVLARLVRQLVEPEQDAPER